MERWVWAAALAVVFGLGSNAVSPQPIAGMAGTMVGFFLIFYLLLWVVGKISGK